MTRNGLYAGWLFGPWAGASNAPTQVSRSARVIRVPGRSDGEYRLHEVERVGLGPNGPGEPVRLWFRWTGVESDTVGDGQLMGQEIRCPLFVVRKHYDDEKDDYTRPRVEPCGEPVWLEVDEAKYLETDGVMDTTGPTWKVACHGGHVLLLPDHEADDAYWRIPFDPAYLAEAGVTSASESTERAQRTGAEHNHPAHYLAARGACPACDELRANAIGVREPVVSLTDGPRDVQAKGSQPPGADIGSSVDDAGTELEGGPYRCEVTACDEYATKIIVGESGDFHFCDAHSVGRGECFEKPFHGPIVNGMCQTCGTFVD